MPRSAGREDTHEPRQAAPELGLGVFDWLTQPPASPVTYLAILAACALDAVLPVVPSETVVIAASVLAAEGRLWIWLVVVAAAAGGFLGDTGSYALGRSVGASAARRLFRGEKAKRRLSWAGGALDRHGAAIIVVARFIPGGRTATTFTAGTVRLPWPRFAAADAVGATVWATYAAGLGYLGGETFEQRPPVCLPVRGWAPCCWSAWPSEWCGGVPGLAVDAGLAGSRANDHWEGPAGGGASVSQCRPR
jgi:membrane-associated protein